MLLPEDQIPPAVQKILQSRRNRHNSGSRTWKGNVEALLAELRLGTAPNIVRCRTPHRRTEHLTIDGDEVVLLDLYHSEVIRELGAALMVSRPSECLAWVCEKLIAETCMLQGRWASALAFHQKYAEGIKAWLSELGSHFFTVRTLQSDMIQQDFILLHEIAHHFVRPTSSDAMKPYLRRAWNSHRLAVAQVLEEIEAEGRDSTGEPSAKSDLDPEIESAIGSKYLVHEILCDVIAAETTVRFHADTWVDGATVAYDALNNLTVLLECLTVVDLAKMDGQESEEAELRSLLARDPSCLQSRVRLTAMRNNAMFYAFDCHRRLNPDIGEEDCRSWAVERLLASDAAQGRMKAELLPALLRQVGLLRRREGFLDSELTRSGMEDLVIGSRLGVDLEKIWKHLDW